MGFEDDLLYEASSRKPGRSFREFLQHVQDSHIYHWKGTKPLDIAYDYLGRHFEVLIAKAESPQSVFLLCMNSSLGETLVFKRDNSLLGVADDYYELETHETLAPSKRDEVLNDRSVQSQLSILSPMSLILLNSKISIISCYMPWEQYCGELVSRYTSAIQNLTLYTSKVIRRLRLEPVNHDVDCPFCREQVEPSGGFTCGKCGTLHHLSCWQSNGGCSVFGCKPKP